MAPPAKKNVKADPSQPDLRSFFGSAQSRSAGAAGSPKKVHVATRYEGVGLCLY